MKLTRKKNWVDCVLAYAMLFASTSTIADSMAEVAVKAAVVHKIAKFVSWPETAFESSNSPMRFCVVGHQMMFNAFEMLDGKSVHGRPVRVMHLSDPADFSSSCDVLYLSPDDDQASIDWLRLVADSPVLTFGEAGKPGTENSIVKVTIRRDKVRFAIDTQASDRAGLSISAQLLQLAASLGSGGA